MRIDDRTPADPRHTLARAGDELPGTPAPGGDTMTTHHVGRTSSYAGSERPPKKVYMLSKDNPTREAITQFEHMSRGLVPVCAQGDAVAWVVDDTLTPDIRQWCAETAAMVRREAGLMAIRRRSLEPTRRTTSDIEAAVASVLARWPDASAHDVRMTTGLDTQRIVKTEAWLMGTMGRGGSRG